MNWPSLLQVYALGAAVSFAVMLGMTVHSLMKNDMTVTKLWQPFVVLLMISGFAAVWPLVLLIWLRDSRP